MKILLTCLDRTQADQAHTTLKLRGLKNENGTINIVHEHTYNYGDIPATIIQANADSWGINLTVNAEKYYVNLTHLEFNAPGSMEDLMNYHAEKIFVIAKRQLPAPESYIDRIVNMPILGVAPVQADVSHTWIGVKNRKLDVTMGFDAANKLMATVNWEIF